MRRLRKDEKGRSLVFVVIFSAVIVVALLFLLISKLFLIGEEKAPVYTKRKDISPLPKMLTGQLQFDGKLWFANGGTSIEDIEKVTESNSIKKLKFRVSEINAQKLNLFKNEPLTDLALEKNRFDGAMMEEISKFQKLRFLKLGDEENSITDEVIEQLTGPANLKNLVLDHAFVSDRGIKHLGNVLKNLRSLNIGSCQLINDKAVEPILESFPKLHSLAIDNTMITESGAAKLSFKKDLLDLSMANLKISDAGLKKFNTSLTGLNLNGSVITDKSVNTLLKMKRLHKLRLKGTKLTIKGLRRLEKGLPKCKINYPGKPNERGEDKNAWLIDDYKGMTRRADDRYKQDREYRESILKKHPTK